MNFLTHKALGIAAAVPVLVVTAGDFRIFLEAYQRLHDRLGEGRVLAHDLDFLSYQRRRLVEDSVGDTDLAEVVGQSAEAQDLHGVGIEADMLAKLQRGARDPAGVAGGVGVLFLQRPMQGHDHVSVGLLLFELQLLDAVGHAVDAPRQAADLVPPAQPGATVQLAAGQVTGSGAHLHQRPGYPVGGVQCHQRCHRGQCQCHVEMFL